MKKAEEARKGQSGAECFDTKDRWKQTLNDLKNAIGACGIPNYVG